MLSTTFASRQPHGFAHFLRIADCCWKILLLLIVTIPAFGIPAREKDAPQYGVGFVVNVPFPEDEVSQVVQEIVQNGIIRGTKEYSKDEYLSGAAVPSSTQVFPEWTEAGKVFYKVRMKALAPWNFKNSSDVGTLAVRYVIQAQDATHTVLRIDARFVEDFRHIAHASNGSVESAEYNDIHDHLDQIELMKTQAAEAAKAQEPVAAVAHAAPGGETAASAIEMPAPESTAPSPSISPPPQTLEERVKDLRRQVQRLVKAPGAALKSAPFHSAATLQSLQSGTEVLIVISTPYWLGVETHDGKHGWMLRDDLELVP